MYPLTWWHSVLDNIQNLRFETPVTLPVSHTLSPFEMLSKMIYSNTPRIHHNSTETASRTDLRGHNLPAFHGEILEFDIVNQVQVLTKVIFPVESSLFQGSFRAA
jgi:hypothetical protein